jgi:type I restriction enzyme M protein
MTLAHFGWSKSFEVLADAELPDTLAAEWLDNEQTAAREEGRAPPLPELRPPAGAARHAGGESDFSWTVDFAARRAKAARRWRPIWRKSPSYARRR